MPATNTPFSSNSGSAGAPTDIKAPHPMSRSLLLLFLLAPSLAIAELKVATLHPLLTDLAKQVGGDRVTVLPLLGQGADPHAFSPTPGDLTRAADSRLILASGKGLEPYLDRIRDNLRPNQELFEVGRKIPSLLIEVGPVFVCCPNHNQGAIDPHWWHSIAAMRRATRYLAEEFARVDPAGSADYKANAKAYDARLKDLHAWARKQIARIPRSDRKLVTAHAAFGYLCKEFGLKAIPVQGLNRERDPSPRYLAETIQILRRERARAIFPETLANPKVLAAMVRESGVEVAPGSLIADGTGAGQAASFEGMIRHNITTIVQGLSAP